MVLACVIGITLALPRRDEMSWTHWTSHGVAGCCALIKHDYTQSTVRGFSAHARLSGTVVHTRYKQYSSSTRVIRLGYNLLPVCTPEGEKYQFLVL